jgi:shikimate kinase
VVYLRSTPEEVFRRLRHDTQRPLLQVNDPQEKIRDLFSVRDPLYRETAHHVVDTGRPSISKLLNTIIGELSLDGFDTHPSHHHSQHHSSRP